MKYCFHCKKRLKIIEKPSRYETCPFCGTDLKVCVNCKFYDESSYNDCSEPSAQRVAQKERANFCEYFVFMESPFARLDDEPDRDYMDSIRELFREF